MQQYITERKVFSKKWILVAIILIPALIFFILFVIAKSFEFPSEFNVPQKIVMFKDVRKVTGLGKVIPRAQRYMSAPESGQLEAIFVRQGQFLNKGEAILKINNYNLIREAEVASYELSNTTSDVELKKSQLDIMKYKLVSSLTNAETELKIQQLSIDANSLLVESGIVSKIKFQQEKMNVTQAELQVDSIKKQLEMFDKSYEKQILALDKKVLAELKKKAFFEKRIKALTLYAGITGTVRNLELQVGQAINQGQSLVELVETENLVAEVQIPQNSVYLVNVGDTSKIITPNGVLETKVEYIDSVIRNGAATVYLASNQPFPSWLKIDQSIEASIATQKEHLVPTLKKPRAFEQYESWVVYRETSQGDIIRTDISLAINSDSNLTMSPSMNSEEMVYLLPSEYATQSSYSPIE